MGEDTSHNAFIIAAVLWIDEQMGIPTIKPWPRLNKMPLFKDEIVI